MELEHFEENLWLDSKGCSDTFHTKNMNISLRVSGYQIYYILPKLGVYPKNDQTKYMVRLRETENFCEPISNK